MGVMVSCARPLMVGPASGVVSGQAVAFRESCAAMPVCVCVDADFSSIRKVLTYPFRLLRAFLVSRGAVYFTSSRSFKGFYGRDLWIIILAWLSHRRLINHLHGSDFERFRLGEDPVMARLVDWAYGKIELSIAPSARALEQYARYPSMRLELVENFFDSNLSEVAFDKERQGMLAIVYLSNLIFTKGFTVAVDACRLLNREGIPAHLTLCGSPIGDSMMSVEDIKNYLNGLQDELLVSVAGSVQGDVKARVLSEAHVFVLPTTYPTEEAPISILEALASGCYVVSTNQGSIPDMLAGFHADVVAPNAEAFAEAIRGYWKRDDKSRIAEENRAEAVKRYSSSAYREKIRRVVESAHDRA